MYRQYENPYKVQKLLAEAEAELDRAKQETSDEDYDRLIDLCNEVEALKERLNFAWQDEEFDEQYSMENYGLEDDFE